MAPTLGINELEQLFDFRTSPTSLQEVRSFLAALARESAFLNARVFPLVEQAERGTDWYVAYRHDAPNSSYSLQVFVWPSGSRTEIHDHSSWGAFCCVVGSVLEERYERLDDRLRPNRARLKKDWQLMWSLEDGISTVLPYDGGIHRIGNPTAELAISVHLYGSRLGEVDGRDYDPSRDCLGDRREV